MKSAASSTRPGSAERPASSRSIRYGSRQPLQLSVNQQAHTADNRTPVINNESHDNSQDAKQLSFNSAPYKTVTQPAYEYAKEATEENADDHSKVRIEHSLFKQTNVTPIEVHIRCVFLRVGEIDTLNERYYAEVLLEASWQEAKLTDQGRFRFNPMSDWTPRLELVNGIGELNDEMVYSVRYDRQGIATVTEHHKLKGTLWEKMELQFFPLDIQDLSISITTSHRSKEVIFVKDLRKSSGVNRRVFTDEQEWYLFEHVDFELTERVEEHVDDNDTHSIITCSCHVARKYGYFMWNAYFLIFLITSASFATFPIPLNNIGGRVQIACTLLLTSITFRWLCNKALPAISYLTAVDVYAIGSIFSLCVLNIYHGVIGYVNYYTATNNNNSPTTISVHALVIIDRWALVVYTILFFAYQFGTIIWMYCVPWRRRRIMFRKDKEHHLAFVNDNNVSRPPFPYMLRDKTTNQKAVINVSTITDVEET